MASTNLSGLIVPEVFNQYASEESVRLDRLIQSGIVSPEPALNSFIARGGEIHHVPFWKHWDDADNIGTADSTLIVPAARAAAQQKVVIVRRNLSYGSYDLVKWVAGSDPLGEAVAQAAENVMTRRQEMVMSMFVGQMENGSTAGDNNNSFVAADYLIDRRLNNATATPTAPTAATPQVYNLSATTVIDAKASLGDAGTKLGAVIMHSTVYYNLERQELISFLVQSRDIGFGTFQGLSVIVDDLATVYHVGTGSDTGATNFNRHTQYVTFFAGSGLVRNASSGITSVVDRDERAGTGSGEEALIVRRQEIYATEGFSYENASVAPTNTIFETKATWTAVYERKNIPFVAVLTTG